VRRIDAFARWALSLPANSPPRPAALVAAYREVGATAAIYDAPAATASIAAAGGADTATKAGKRGAAEKAWEPKGAAAQLRRILHLVPHIANGEELALHEVAARLGTSVEELQRDLYSLVDRYDMPGGFVEGVQLYVGSDTVSAVTNHLRRPMRLTVAELCALELGLAVLRSLRAPDERQALERARERLRAVIARLPGDPIPDGLHGASLGDVGNTAHLVVVREALRQGRKLRLAYRRSGSQASSERTIAPYLLLSARGLLYIGAFCAREHTTRLFRIDRVESVALMDETFERPDAAVLDTLLRERRAFQGDGAATMRVRYSPRIARWIAEREGKALAADGSLEMGIRSPTGSGDAPCCSHGRRRWWSRRWGAAQGTARRATGGAGAAVSPVRGDVEPTVRGP
jgi:proteasome accessory factor C